MENQVTLVTDGSCLGNPGPGGWACILKVGEHERVLSGGHPATTNNRMELLGAIEGLKALKRPCRVELVTDSQYVRKGITGFLPRWMANRWRSASGKPVLNQDLWHQLAELTRQHEVSWSWTAGHGANEEQNRADELARKIARKYATVTVQ